MLPVASIHNSAALVPVVLPRELLMHIFRSIHPNSPSAIRVTHVCRLWRRLVDAVPEFWEDLLQSPDWVIFDAPRWSTLVLDFVAKSAPRMIGSSLDGESLPLIPTHTAHLRRFKSISIYSITEDAPELAAFYDLHMPHLEELTIVLTPH